jgi:L-lactate utilization protein LutB
MNEIYKDIYKKRCHLAVTALTANGFDAVYADNIQEAYDKAMALIPAGASIGVGGSNTIREVGLVDALEKQGYTVYQHWKKELTKEEKVEIRKKQLTCDVFLTSSNAITLKGQLLNVDGTGNRVAAMSFGPQKVIIIAGANKIVDTLDDAYARIRNIVAPLNGRRLSYKTPCALAGKCADCKTDERMCNITVIMDRKPRLTDITVILVGEELGY